MILSSASLSSITAKPSIIEDIDFLVGTDSTQFPLADKLRLINGYYYDVVSDIIGYDGTFTWDDTNKTDFPIGTTNLVDSQQDYALPSDFLQVLRVEVMNSSGDYTKLKLFDQKEIGIALSEFQKTPGMPLYYREVGNSIELYPKPSSSFVTLTAGLKVYYERTMTEFTKNDAAVSPGFAPQFHKILSIGPAYEFAYVKGLNNASRLKERLDGLRAALKDYYSDRNKDQLLIIRPHRVLTR